MLFMDKNGTCGAFAISNALLLLSVPDIKKIAGTTGRNGTSKRGIARAVRHFGKRPSIYFTRNRNNAWRWISRWVDEFPIIVLLDRQGHWSTLVGRDESRLVLVDPSWDGDWPGDHTHTITKRDFMERWRGNGYYAIRVS